jgi:hypothetical protein
VNSKHYRAVWTSVAVLIASVAFLRFAFTRKDPWADAGDGIPWAVLGALSAVISLLYTLLPRPAHAWVTRALLGLGAVTATACSIMFGRALWVHRALLMEDLGLPFIALCFAVACGASFIAWGALLRELKRLR